MTTRRDFIAAVAAFTGASGAYTAARALGLMEGGDGCDCTLLEARDRVGGRNLAYARGTVEAPVTDVRVQ